MTVPAVALNIQRRFTINLSILSTVRRQLWAVETRQQLLRHSTFYTHSIPFASKKILKKLIENLAPYNTF